MRLGLALHRSVEEVHLLPYPEYKRWWTFYLIEPWGWWNEEYQYARLLSMLRNVNISKESDAKQPKDFMRDMPKDLFDRLKEAETPDVLDGMTLDEKRAWYIEQINRTFGLT
jgi:hypothetical protein